MAILLCGFLILLGLIDMARGVMSLEGNIGRGSTGRLFFTICLAGSLWCIGFGLMGIADTNVGAYIFRGVALLGIYTCCPLLVLYLVKISGDTAFNIRSLKIALVSGAVICFFSMVFPAAVTFVDTSYGRYYMANSWHGNYVFQSYIVILLVIWFVICHRWWRNAKYKRERRMVRFAVWAGIIVSLAQIFDVLLPSLGYPALPTSAVANFIAISFMYENFRQYKDVSISGSKMIDFIFRKVSIPVVTFNDRFEITECNDDACTYLDAQRDELVGSVLSDWVIGLGANDIERIKSEFVNLSPEFDADVLVKKNDSICQVKCSVIYDRFNEVISVIAILNDKTQIEESRRKVEDSEKEADRANLARETFFRGMNSSIVNVVKYNIETASEMLLYENDETATQSLYDIISKNNELLSVVESMLDAAKMESGQMVIKNEMYNLEELLSRLIESAALKVDDTRVRFVTQISPGLPRVLYGDAHRIEQMLGILLDNAIRFTNEGYILLRAQSRIRYGKVSLTFAVSDTGAGIREDEIDGFFNYFGRNGKWDSNNMSAGLDLSICRSLVKLMGGEMVVRSAPGKGTTFTLTFDQTTESETAMIPVNDYTDKIILIEENQLNADSLEKLLGELGISCEIVVGREIDETMLPEDDEATLVIVRAGVLGRMRRLFEKKYPSARFIPIYSFANYQKLPDGEDGICGLLAFAQLGKYLR